MLLLKDQSSHSLHSRVLFIINKTIFFVTIFSMKTLLSINHLFCYNIFIEWGSLLTISSIPSQEAQVSYCHHLAFSVFVINFFKDLLLWNDWFSFKQTWYLISNGFFYYSSQSTNMITLAKNKTSRGNAFFFVLHLPMSLKNLIRQLSPCMDFLPLKDGCYQIFCFSQKLW